MYFTAGAADKYKAIAADIESDALHALEVNPNDIRAFRILVATYENLKDNKKLYDLWQRIYTLYPNDPNVKANVEKYKKLVSGNDSSESGVQK